MLASAPRSMKPKLSLSISTATSTTRPNLSLKSPSFAAPLRSPISPAANSPTALNTRLNQRGYSHLSSSSHHGYGQQSYSYNNSSSSRSILKKTSSGQSSSVAGRRQLSFDEKPRIYCVTPIEDESERREYYGEYKRDRMSRDERRWGRR